MKKINIGGDIVAVQSNMCVCSLSRRRGMLYYGRLVNPPISVLWHPPRTRDPLKM